ncbi:MAG: polyprenyl synthetase family protein [Cytophagales bacterium]|nr:polyprenyl synthetase family protein [Bernardetiaceae bacterium]MDW8211524.1 polyprenyl synthetase family protein [Cytophagales bacterium]
MTVTLETIKSPIAAEMEIFEIRFRDSMRTKVLLLDKIMTYIVKHKGKQIRPMFVFLAAGMCGNITEATYRGAALIELLHTATLVHDDVVDAASYRRGFFSINALWKNKIAVLVGDYLLSRGLLLSIEHGDFDLLRIVSDAVRQMSEGELLQMEKARRLDIDEAIYFEIIRQKTATLIASCCAVGAASVGAGDEIVKRMSNLGEKIGIAFQIKDDLFDYSNEEIGKPVGIDIKEKKMTLPLIFALNQAKRKEKNYIINLIKNKSENSQAIAEVIDFVRRSGGIEYACQVMEGYVRQARAILCNFGDSPYKTAMLQLIEYVIKRKH